MKVIIEPVETSVKMAICITVATPGCSHKCKVYQNGNVKARQRVNLVFCSYAAPCFSKEENRECHTMKLRGSGTFL